MPLAAFCPYRRHATTFVVAASLVALLVAAGCPTSPEMVEQHSTAAAKPPPAVRLLVVDDPALATAIEREWKASGRGELAITRAKVGDLADTKRIAADVVIYPAAMLGDFAERRLIAEMPAEAIENSEFAQSDIFPLLRRRECTWGEKVYAVPFGSPQLMLVYRKDLVDELKLQPPTTWHEYGELIAALEPLAGRGDDPLQAGCAEPIADGWGAKLLLARAAAYARHPNQYSALFDYQTMEPLIAEPPYVRALEELVGARGRQKAKDERLTPSHCQELLITGQRGLAIVSPLRDAAGGAPKPWPAAKFGCVELPGAREVYNFQTKQWTSASEVSRVPLLGISGRLGSITTSARHTRAAADALLWLAGKEKGPLIASQSAACTLARSSQVPQASRFVSGFYGATFAGEFGAALESANGRPLSVEMPRIPGHEEYMSALDAAVQAAVANRTPAAEALAAAAQKWQEITKKHGEKEQRAAYMRSLGLEP